MEEEEKALSVLKESSEEVESLNQVFVKLLSNHNKKKLEHEE